MVSYHFELNALFIEKKLINEIGLLSIPVWIVFKACLLSVSVEDFQSLIFKQRKVICYLLRRMPKSDNKLIFISFIYDCLEILI